MAPACRRRSSGGIRSTSPVRPARVCDEPAIIRRSSRARIAAGAGERNLTGATAPTDVGFSIAAYRWSDGKLAWQHTLAAEGPLPSVHDKHNLASPSPVTDADVVIGWFGTGQIVGLDHGGKRLWSKHLGKEYAPFDLQWGHSSSPVLVKDLVILVCYHGPSAYVLALDKRTGAVKWKIDRQAPLLSYSTPLILDGPRGVGDPDQHERRTRGDRRRHWRRSLARARRQPVSDSSADACRRDDLHDAWLSFRTRTSRSGPAGRATCRQPRRLARRDRRAIHLVARPLSRD